MAVDDRAKDIIGTPWGGKRWGYIKHTMELENWLLDHVNDFSQALMADFIAQGLNPEEAAEKFSEAYPELSKWFHDLYVAVYTDPEQYEGRLN
jgi:hypothetical protein